MQHSGIPRRAFLRIALIGTGAGLLAACGPAAPSASPTTAPAAAPKPTSAAAPTTASAPAATSAPATAAPVVAGAGAPKNAFKLAVRSDPPSIDPAVAADLPGRMAVIQSYDSLLRYEGKPPKAVPNLAESIDGSPDGKTYTVNLRPNLKFHDGTKLDAAAVAFSMDRLLKMGKGAAGAFTDLLQPGDTKAVDPATVQFNLRRPSAVFPATLPFFFIVNPTVVSANKAASGAYGADGDFGEQYLQTHDAGSGPYVLKSRTPNAQLEFEAFSDYWRGWKPNQYGTFTYKIVPEPATAALLMKQGQVDGVYEFYASNIFDDLAGAPNVQVRSDLGVKPLYVFMNNQKPPTDNPKVRQAIASAFDYDQAVKGIMASVQKTDRLPGPLPHQVWSAMDKNPYDLNIEKAKSLLSEAGVKPGDLNLEYGASGGPADVRTKVGLLVQANIAQLGGNVDISQNTWADMLQQMSQPDTTKHLYGVYLSYDYADPDALLFPGWHSASHGTWSGSQWYANAQVDQLIQQGRTTIGDDKRMPFYQQIQNQIVTDSPSIFVFNEPVRVALGQNVGGYDYVVGVYNYYVYNLFKQG